MSSNGTFDAGVLATVTVTFNPDMPLLAAQLRALPKASLKILVDNASEPSVVTKIETLVAETANAHLLRNPHNLGLAAATNRGIRALSGLSPGKRFALLLDQDSEPHPGSIETLVTAFIKLDREGPKVGCVGPLLVDPATMLAHGFHQCTRWRWKRIYPATGSTAPVSCANLNGSGTLVPVELFLRLGGLDESLFIDHVDTEWAFRVMASGRTLWGVPEAVFSHRMGDASKRLWLFGWHVWPLRSPRRHYFLFRNAVVLMRRSYVPCVWKIWAVAKLVLTSMITAIAGPDRSAQLSHMWRGVREGMTKEGGA